MTVSHLLWTYKTAMATVDAKFLDTITKSKIHDCKCNLAPMIQERYQLVKSWNWEIISCAFLSNYNTLACIFKREHMMPRHALTVCKTWPGMAVTDGSVGPPWTGARRLHRQSSSSTVATGKVSKMFLKQPQQNHEHWVPTRWCVHSDGGAETGAAGGGLLHHRKMGVWRPKKTQSTPSLPTKPPMSRWKCRQPLDGVRLLEKTLDYQTVQFL